MCWLDRFITRQTGHPWTVDRYLHDESKYGIFIVWGVYSIPVFESEWFWDYWKDPTNIRQNVFDFMKKTTITLLHILILQQSLR